MHARVATLDLRPHAFENGAAELAITRIPLDVVQREPGIRVLDVANDLFGSSVDTVKHGCFFEARSGCDTAAVVANRVDGSESVREPDESVELQERVRGE